MGKMTPLQQINEKINQLRKLMAPMIQADQTKTFQYKNILDEYESYKKIKKQLELSA